MVSLISLPEDDATSPTEIAQNAALFGLYLFLSAGIVAESGEELSCLEMYCSVPRSPSASEFQLIERAKCLPQSRSIATLRQAIMPMAVFRRTRRREEMCARG